MYRLFLGKKRFLITLSKVQAISRLGNAGCAYTVSYSILTNSVCSLLPSWVYTLRPSALLSPLTAQPRNLPASSTPTVRATPIGQLANLGEEVLGHL